MEEVVLISSGSEDDEITASLKKKNDKYFKQIWAKVKDLIFTSSRGLSDSNFPHQKFVDLCKELQKCFGEIRLTSMKAFLWKSLLQWIHAMKLSYDGIKDLKYDDKFNLTLVDLMAQYINYKCKKLKQQIVVDQISATEVDEDINETLTNLHVLFNGNTPYIVMTLLKVDVDKEYAKVLYPIFRKFLSNKHLHQSNEIISYLRLVLCYKQWKKMVPFGDDKEEINVIAQGILPASVPSVDSAKRPFANISDVIDYAKQKGKHGTRILLTNKSFDLEEAIKKYFKQYESYISRGDTSSLCRSTNMLSLADCDPMEPSKENKKNLTRIREIWRPPRKDKGTKIMTSPSKKNGHKHLSKPCDNSFKLNSSSKSKKESNYSASNSINLSRNSENNKVRNIYKVTDVIELCSSDENTPDESARKSEPVPPYKKQPKSVSNRVIKPQSHSSTSKVLADSEKASHSKVLRNLQHKKFRKKAPKNIQNLNYSSDSDDSSVNAKKVIRGKLVRRAVRSVSSDSYASDYDNIDTRKKFGERVLQVNRTLTNVKKTKQPCIQGEVSSTTFPDIHVPTPDQPTTSSLQCHQSSLEVHSSSNLQDFQNGREVGSGVLQILKTPSPDIREKVFMTDPTRPSLSTMTYTDYESLYRDMVRAEQKSIDTPCIANFNSNVNYHREVLPYECGPLRVRNFQSTFPLSPEPTNIDSETKKLKDDLAVENQTVVKENTNVESAKFTSQCATSSNEPSFLNKSLTNRTEVEICAADRKSSSQKDKFIQTEIEEPLHTHVPCSKSLPVHTEDFDNTNLEDITPLLKNQTEAVTPPCHLDVRKIPNKEIRPNSSSISSIEKKIKSTSCSLLSERTSNSKQPKEGETNKAKSFACSIEEVTSDVLPLQHSHILENVEAETCSSTLTNEDISRDDSLRTCLNNNKNCSSKRLESNITRDNESLDINCKIQQASKDGSSVRNEPAIQSMEIQNKHENTNHLQMKDSSFVQSAVEKKENISQISSEILTTNLKSADSMLSVISSDKEAQQNSGSEIENRIELLIEEEICDVELDEANPICAEEENALLCEDEIIFKGNAKPVQPTYNEAQRALEETAENSMKNCEIDSNSVDATDNEKTEAFLRILDECLDGDTLPEVFASVNESSNTPEIETTLKLHSSCSSDKMDAKSSCCEKEDVLQKQKEFFSPKEQCAAGSGELKDGAELQEKQQHNDRDIGDIIRIPCGEPTEPTVEKNCRVLLVDTQMDEIQETRDKCSPKMQADINDGVKITSEKEMSTLKRSSNMGEPTNRIMEACIQSHEFISDAQEKSINDDTKLENIFERTNAQESKTVYSPLQNSKDDNGLDMLQSNEQEFNSSKKTDTNKNVQTVSCEFENSPSMGEIVMFADSETKTKTDSVSSNDCELTVDFTENDFTHGEKDISDSNEEHSLENENYLKESVCPANVLEQNLSVSEQLPISANVEVDEKIKETAECQVRDLTAETEVVEKANKTCSDSNGQFSEAKPLSNPSIEICINNKVSAEDKPKDSFPENDSLENKEVGLSTSVIKTTVSLSEAEENISTDDQSGNAFISSEFNENLQEVSSEVEINSLSNVDAGANCDSNISPNEFVSMPSSEKTFSNRKEIADINVITTETRRQSFEKQNSISISDVMEENFNEGDGTIVKITHKGTVETVLSCENDCTEQMTVDIDVNNESCDEHELVLQENVIKQTHTLEQTNEIVKESTSNVSSVIGDSYEVQKQIRDESCVNDTTEETDFFDKENRKEKEDDEILLHEMEKTGVRSEVEIFSVSGNDCQMFETTNKNLVPKGFDEKISPEMCSKKPTLSRDAEVEKAIVDPFCAENDLQSNYNNEVSKDINEEVIADMRLEKNTNSNGSEVDKMLVSASSTKKGVIGKNNSRVPKDMDIPSEKDTYSNDNEVEKTLASTNEKDLESRNNDEVPKEMDEEVNIIPCAKKPEILSWDAVETTVIVSESNREKDLTFKNKDQLDACKSSKDSSKSDSAELTEIQNVTVRNSTQEADTSQISRINALQYGIEDTEVEGTHKKQSESGDMTKIQSDESSEHNMETIAENETFHQTEPLKMFCEESKFGVRESCQVNKKPITSDCDVEKILEPIISCAEEKADKSCTSTTVPEFQKTVDNKDLEVLKNDNSKVERKSTVIEYGTKMSENPNQNSSCIVDKTKESYKILGEVNVAKQLEQTFSEDKEQQAEDMYNDNQIETDNIITQDQMEVDRDLKQRTSIKIINNVGTTIKDERTSSTLIEENTDIILNENQNMGREALLMEKRVETRVEANSETNLIEKHKDDQEKKEGDIKTIVDASESILSKSNENSMNIDSITEGSDARIALHNVSSLQNRPTVLTTIAPCTASQDPLSFPTDNLEKNLQPDSAKLFFDQKNGNDFSSRCERDYLGKLGKAVRQSGGSMNKMLTHDKIVSDMDQAKLSSTDETIASKSQSMACLTEVNSTKLEEMNLRPLECQQNDGSSLSSSEFICPSNDVCSNFFLRNKKSIPNEKALVKSPEENYERTPFKLRIKRRLSECANNLENLLNEDKCSPSKLNNDAPNCPSSTLVGEARSECENFANKQIADEPNIVDTVGNKKTLSEFDIDRDNHVDNVISEIDRIQLDGLIKQKVLSPKRPQSSCNEPISSDETEVDIEKQQIWMNKLGLRKKPNEKTPFTGEEPKDKKEKGRLDKLIISRRETTTSTGIIDTFISRINAVSENISDTTKKGETVSLGPSYNLTLLASEAEKLTPIFDTVSPAGEEPSKSPRSGLRSGSTQSKKKGKSLRSTRNSCTEVEKEEIELNVRNALQTVQNKPKSALKNPNSKQRKEKRTVTFADTLGAWKQKKLTEFLKLLRSSNGRLQLTSNLKDKLSEVLMILSEYSKEYDIRPSELCIKNDEFVVDMTFDEAESCKEDLSKKGLKTSKRSLPKKDIEQIIGELILKTLQKNKSIDQLAPPKIDYEQGMKIIQNSAIVEYIEPGTNTIPMDLVDDRDQPHLLNEHKDVADDSSELSLIIKTPASKRGRKPKINNQKVVTVMEKKCDDIKSKKSVGSSKKQLTSLNLSQLLYPASESMVRSKDQFADITVISDNDSSDESLSDYLYKSNQYLNAVLDNKPLNLKNNSQNVRDTAKNTGKYVQSFANAKPLLSPNNFLSISIDQCSATQILDKKKTKKSSKKGKQEAQRQEVTASGQRVFGNAKPVAPNVEAKASTVVTEAKFKTLLEPEIIIENASGNVNLNKMEVHTDFLSPSNCTSIEEIVCKVVQDVCRKQSVLGLSMHNINNSEFQNSKNKSRKNEIKSTTPSKGQKTCAKPTDRSVKPISATKSKLHSKAGKSLKISSSNKSHSNAKVNQIPESKTASPSGKSTISHQIDPTSSDLISLDLLQKEGVSFDMEGNIWIHSSTSSLPNQNAPVSNVLGPNNAGNIFWDVDGNILAFNLCLATDNATFPIKEARIEEVISSKPDALVKPCEDSMNSQESTESVSQNSIVNHPIHKTVPLCERKSEKLVGSKKRKSKRCKQLTPDIVTNENSCNESFEDASKVTQDLVFKHTEQSETIGNWTTPINGLAIIEPVLMRETPIVASEISSVSPSIINYKKEGKNPSLRKSRKVGLLDMVEMLNNNRKEVSAKEKSGTKKDENNFFQTKALDLSAKIKQETEPSQEIVEITAIPSNNRELLPDATISNQEISTLQEHLEEQREPKSTCNELKATEDNVEIVANDEVNENLKRGGIEMSEKEVSITTEKEIPLNSVSDIVSKESAEMKLNTDEIKDKEPIYDHAENEIEADRENKEDVGETETIESDKMDRPTLLNISVEGHENGSARLELSGEAQLQSLDTNNVLMSNVDAKKALHMNLNNTDVNLETPLEDAHKSVEENRTVEEVIKKDHLNDVEKAVDTEKNVDNCKNLHGTSRKETFEQSCLNPLDVLPIKDEPRMPTVATKASKKDMTQVLKLMETMKQKETEQEHKIREEGNKASHKTIGDLNLKIDATKPLFNNAITADNQSHSNDRKLKSIKLKISNPKEDNKIRNKELRKKHKKNKKRKESVTKEDASTSKAKDIVLVDKTVVENVDEKLVLPKAETSKNESMKDEIMVEASCKTIENALSEPRTSPKSEELFDTTEMSTNVELLDTTEMSTNAELLDTTEMSTNVELLDTTEMSTNVELLDTTEMSTNVELFDTTEMSTNVDNNKPAANDTCRLVESESMKKDVTSTAEQNEASTQILINSNGPHQLDSLSIENSVTQKDGKNSLSSITESIDENLDIAAEVEIVSGDGIDAEVGKKLEVVPSESTTAKASGNEAIIDKKTIPLPSDATSIKDDEHKILFALKDDSEVQPGMFESNNLSTKLKECLESTKVITESMNKLETDIVSLELKDAETNATSSTDHTIEKVVGSPAPCSENIENQGLIIEDVDKNTSESTDTLSTDIVKEAKNDSIPQSTNNTEEVNDEPAKVPTENNVPIEKASDFPVHSFIYSDEKLFLDKNPNFESCDLPENLLSAESPSYQKNKLRISTDKLKSEIITSTIENEDNNRSLQCTTKSELLSLDASNLEKDEKRDLTLETACTKLCYVKLRKLKNVSSVSNAENEALDGETKLLEDTSCEIEKSDEKVEERVVENKVVNEGLLDADQVKNSVSKAEPPTVAINTAKKKARKRPLHSLSDDAEEEEDLLPKVKKQSTKKRIVCDRWENEERLISKYTNLLQLKNMFASHLMQFLCTFERSPTLEVFFTFNKILVTFIYETLSSEDYSTVSCARTYLHLCTKTKQLQSKNIDEVALDEIEQKYTLLKKKRNEFRSLEKIKLLDDFLQHFKLNKKNLFTDTWIRKNYSSIQRHLHLEPVESHFKAEIPENVEYVTEAKQTAKTVSENSESIQQSAKISPPQETSAIKLDSPAVEFSEIATNNSNATNKDHTQPIATTEEKEGVKPALLDAATMLKDLNVDSNKPCEQVIEQNTEHSDGINISGQTCVSVECDTNVGAEEIIASEKDANGESRGTVDCDADIGSPSMLQNSEGDITSTINNTMMKLIQIGNLETISSEMDPFSMTNSFAVTGDMNSSFKTTDTIGFDENLDNSQNHGSEDWPDLLLESIMEDLNAQKDYSGKKKEDCMISGRYDVRNYFPEASLGAAGVLSPLIENNMTELVSLENETMENTSARASTDQSVNMNDILKESLLLRGNNLAKCETNTNGNFVLNAVSPFDILIPLESGEDIASQSNVHISSEPASINFDLNTSNDNNLNALDFVDYVPEVVDTILTSLTLDTAMSKCSTRLPEIQPQSTICNSSINQVSVTTTSATSATASSKENLHSLTNNETKTFQAPTAECVTSVATSNSTPKVDSVQNKFLETNSTMTVKQFYIPEKDLREASTSKVNSNHDTYISSEDTVDVNKKKSPGYTKPKPPAPKPQVTQITSKLKSHPFPSWKTVSPVKRDIQSSIPISKAEASNSSKNISLTFTQSSDGENATGQSNRQCKQVTPSTLLHMPDLEAPQNTTISASKRSESHPSVLHVKKEIIVASQKLPSPFPTIDDTQYICSSFGYSSEVEVETSSPGPVAKKRPRGNCSVDVSEPLKKLKVEESKTMDPFDKLKSEPVNVPLPNNAKYRKTYSKPAVVNTHVQVKPSAPVVSVMSAVSAVGSVLSSKVSPMRETNYSDSVKTSSPNKVKIHVTDCEILVPPTTANKPVTSAVLTTSTSAPVVKHQTSVANLNVRRPSDSQTVLSQSIKKRTEPPTTIISQGKIVHAPPSSVSYKVFTYNPPTSKSAVAQNASNRIKYLSKEDDSKNNYKRSTSYLNDSTKSSQSVYTFKAEESKPKKVFSQPAIASTKTYTHTSQARNMNGTEAATSSLRHNDPKRTSVNVVDRKRRHSVNESHRSHDSSSKSHSRHGNVQRSEILDSGGVTEDPKVTPLTVRTAWDYKPISTDEILEHLAKQKKLKSN